MRSQKLTRSLLLLIVVYSFKHSLSGKQYFTWNSFVLINTSFAEKKVQVFQPPEKLQIISENICLTTK